MKTFLKLQSIAFDNANNLPVTDKVQVENLDAPAENPSTKEPDLSPSVAVAKMTSKDKLELAVGLVVITLVIWAVIHFFRKVLKNTCSSNRSKGDLNPPLSIIFYALTVSQLINNRSLIASSHGYWDWGKWLILSDQ
jgi:hypothetical protein